ncbi:MAG: hypothetical protein ACHQHN_02000 [Sphingobacteriales bacterium]
METIESQRSFFGFYLKLTVWCIFYGALGFFTGGLFIHQYNSPDFEPRNYGLIPLLLFLVAGAIYTIYKYCKTAPTIEINNESITFNHSLTYFWRDLECAKLTGKRPYLFFTYREGVSLKFKGREERIFLDKMYENSPEMKVFIEAMVSDKINSVEAMTNAETSKFYTTIPESFDNKSNPVHNDFKVQSSGPNGNVKAKEPKGIFYFKGSPVFSFEGIIMWGLIVFFWIMGVFDFIKNHHLDGIVGLSILSVLFFILFSRRFYYFLVSNDTFFIKHYYFFWITNEYPLAEIKEVVFEQQSRMPIELRIINKDFTTAKYPAASLWSKTWMDLKAYFEQHNIKVRNECGVSYEPFKFKFFNDD